MDPAARRGVAPAHVPVLDGLRGLLTLLVLVHHIVGAVLYGLPPAEVPGWEPWFVFAQGTAPALPMYFVISGFVIFLPAARHGGNLGDLGWYATRRIARIVPAYYLNIAFLLLSWPFLFPDTPSPMASRHGIGLVVGHLAFLQTVLFDRTEIGFGLNGSVWTLTLEEFFYFTIPFVAVLLFRRPLRVLAITFVFSMSFRLGCLYMPELAQALSLPVPASWLPSHVFHQFPGYAFMFALGSTAAWYYVHRYEAWSREDWKRRWMALHVVSLVAIPLLMWRSGHVRRLVNGIVPDVTHDVVLAIVFAALMLAAAFGPEAAQKLYTNRFCRFLGDVSYGVYLWHMVLIQLVYRYSLLPVPATTEAIAIYLAWVTPGSLALGWASYRFVERPLSQRIRQLREELATARKVGATG
jgi:peptidoglycan/LPS O-acetylase OafA/YrhL